MIRITILIIILSVPYDYSNHIMNGIATWYGDEQFIGNRTPSGIICDGRTPQIAHKTLPFGVVVKITNITNGRSTVAIVTDRGPYIKGRVVDFNAKWQINRICDSKHKRCDLVRQVKLEVVDDTYACKQFRCLSKKFGKYLEDDEIRKLKLTWFK